MEIFISFFFCDPFFFPEGEVIKEGGEDAEPGGRDALYRSVWGTGGAGDRLLYLLVSPFEGAVEDRARTYKNFIDMTGTFVDSNCLKLWATTNYKLKYILLPDTGFGRV